ncbi:MAG: zinc-dependent metalloprotease family protein, partial [Bacteroidota bacterium]
MSRVSNLDYSGDIKVVTIGNIAEIQKDAVISFSIPGVERSFTAELESIDYRGPLDYTWAGKLTNEEGNITLTYSIDGIIGYIHLIDDSYFIHPISSTKNALVKDNAEPMNKICATIESDDENRSSASVELCEANDECNALIDILILVNPDAQDWITRRAPSRAGLLYIANAIQSIEDAMRNSEIENIEFRYFIDSHPFITTDNISNDAFRMRSSTRQIREDISVDLVIMLTNQGYAGAFGIAFVGPGFNQSYAIVEVPFLLAPRFTLAHEMAHLFGARHDRGSFNPGELDECPHAYIFQDENRNERRTILADLNPFSGLSRIPYYSNPKVLFQGRTTGTDEDNNAGRISNTKCIVASHRDAGFTVAIAGQGKICIEDEYTILEASVSPPFIGLPGRPPYEYEWRCNESGIFDSSDPGILLGTETEVQVSASDHRNSFFFVQLKVTSSDGVVKTKTKKIIVDPCGYTYKQINQLATRHSFENLSSNTNFKVYPNPVADIATVDISIEKSDKID